MAEIHLLGIRHEMGPDPTIDKLIDLGAGPGTMYFSELQRIRFLGPASRPALENYVMNVKAYLLGKGASIVPMGREGFPSYKPNPHFYEVHAMLAAEDRYMVDKVIVPNLGNCEVAVIDLSLGHRKNFLRLFRNRGLEATCHDLVHMSPIVFSIESVMDYAEGRRETILKSEFFEAFYGEMGRRLGIEGIHYVDLDRLVESNAELKEAFDEALKDFDFEAFNAEQYARKPHHIKALRIGKAYGFARGVVPGLFDPAAHAPITLESERERKAGNEN